jgi:hypothetical protein
MLLRAILNHVPPIFKCTDFEAIASNYAGGKSFKEQMNTLEKSLRKVADAFQHEQIRPSEVLPTRTQVDFSQAMDTLLGEITRLLK